jgi:hypothetical protein
MCNQHQWNVKMFGTGIVCKFWLKVNFSSVCVRVRVRVCDLGIESLFLLCGPRDPQVWRWLPVCTHSIFSAAQCVNWFLISHLIPPSVSGTLSFVAHIILIESVYNLQNYLVDAIATHSFLVLFFVCLFLGFGFWFLETGFLCVVLAILELTL